MLLAFLTKFKAMPTFKMRLILPSRRLLANLCVCGAMASISGLAYLHWKLEDRVRQADYYQLAIKTLRQHGGAVRLLGEPIRESGFSLTNTKNVCDGQRAQLQVSVNGTKDKGTVFFWATNNREKGWLIDRLELETKQYPHTRFLLKKPRDQALEDVVNDDEENEEDHEHIVVPEPKPIGPQMHQQPEQPTQVPQHAFVQPGYQEGQVQTPNQPKTLHQHQGQEPKPYIQTADGGKMN
ncbi:uncharacterized protein LOC111076304 [Drosophila obscura]|uniref:uncharacterized protein LOC111076304 n=1 Tax=Drosophila obscura TaxID=7282 RepID=UPI001BB29938|nr:uncharacterized protein LOC111076304 [Drosophila obscura]